MNETLEQLQKELKSIREFLNATPDSPVAGQMRAREKELETQIHTAGGAIVAGDVDTGGGDFVGRDQNIHIYQGRYEGETPRTAVDKRRIYCQYVAQQAGALPLRGMDRGEADAGTQRQALSLSGVYTSLDVQMTVPEKIMAEMLTKGHWIGFGYKFDEHDQPKPTLPLQDMGTEKKDTRPVSALEAAILSQKMVLLGDPGSGKTTFVNYLTQAFAQADFTGLDAWPQTGRKLLPVVVVLRDFYRWTQTQTCEANANLLWKFILHDLESKNLAFAGDILEPALEAGQVLMLLDGLDEVPPNETRSLVRDSVLAFHQRYGRNRFLVTCRVLSYQDATLQLPQEDFRSFELAPFDGEKIRQFIEAWYNEVAQKWGVPVERTKLLAEKLLGAINRPDLARLAPNPLLLTVMALVHTEYGELPDSRAQLYQQAVDVLLWRWEQEKNKGGQSQMMALLQKAGRDRNDLLDVLGRLAFEAHAHGGDTQDPEAVSGISQMDLLAAIRELHPQRSLDWAEKIVNTMRLRAGLLLDRDGAVFTFPHRTFQEYLAGTHLALLPDFPYKSCELVAQGDFWRVVILLAVGHLVHNNRNRPMPLMLVNELCPEQANDDINAWQRAVLAGEALLEMGVIRAQDSETGKSVLRRVRARLAHIVEEGLWFAPQRSEAGGVLGRLGDPRFDPQLFYMPTQYRGKPEETLGFVRIPTGSFTLGSNKEQDKDAWDDEQPQHEINIPYDYWVARYPVTVAQFADFVEKSAYQPSDERSVRENPNWPVRYVTWYDARAYCEWLTGEMTAVSRQTSAVSDEQFFWQDLADGRLIARLPSEAEWEKAARSDDARRYTWGENSWNPELANIDTSNFGHPTPVGIYPQGASPYGVLDMSGNLFEWTRSLLKNYPYDSKDGREDLQASGPRVVRGGSWISSNRGARCASRGRFNPDNRDYHLGFRVILSPAKLP